MAFVKKFLSGFTILILTGCTQAGVGVANLPARFGDLEIKKDISYGLEEEHKLDIYIPSSAKDKKLPVLVFFYGGRWSEGSKDMYAFVGEAFAQKDYIVVIADYQKYPDIKFPVFVEDGARAVAWVYNHIEDYNGDAGQIFLSGHSAGAHTAALLTADERYLAAEGIDKPIITAFAGLAGPYDFVPDAEDLKDIFGPPERYPQMRVTTFIDGSEPPMLLLWGDNDEAVWQRNIDLLEKKIKEENGVVEAKIYKGMNHVDIVAGLTWFFRGRSPVFNDVIEFFDQYR